MGKKIIVTIISSLFKILAIATCLVFASDDHALKSQENDIYRSQELMKQFFKLFDSNHNGELEYYEAEEFFFTVEYNVEYRYDDEDELEPSEGPIVGDGRDGSCYHQLPLETYVEKMGDCEDYAILEAAFYNYFGIEAYVAGVDSEGTGNIDHALCIIKINSISDWEELLGHPVHSFEIDGDDYLFVDNTYSEEFGAIYQDGEYQKLNGRFELHETLRWEEGAVKHTADRRPLPDFPGIDHWEYLDDGNEEEDQDEADSGRQNIDEKIAFEDGWVIKKPWERVRE